MKKVLILTLLCLCITFLYIISIENRKEFDLIIVAGQSNAVGFETNPDRLPSNPADKKVILWWRCGDPPSDKHDSTSGQQWTYLQVQPKGNPASDNKLGRQYGNFHHPRGGFGPEIGLARTLMAKQDKKLAILKVAFNSTSLRYDWNPSGIGKQGESYRSLVFEANAAIIAANADGIILKPRALVWVQGESDARLSTSAAAYEKKLGEMIERLRKDLASPKLIALLGVNTKYRFKNFQTSSIVEGEKKLASRLAYSKYVDTSSAAVADSFHFSTEGTLEVGRLFAEELMKVESTLLKE